MVFRLKIWGARDNGIPPRSTPEIIVLKKLIQSYYNYYTTSWLPGFAWVPSLPSPSLLPSLPPGPLLPITWLHPGSIRIYACQFWLQSDGRVKKGGRGCRHTHARARARTHANTHKHTHTHTHTHTQWDTASLNSNKKNRRLKVHPFHNLLW